MTQSDFLAALMHSIHKNGPIPTSALPMLIVASGVNPADAILALAKGETVGLIVPVNASGNPCLPVESENIVLTTYGAEMTAKFTAPRESNPYDAAGDEFLAGWDATEN